MKKYALVLATLLAATAAHAETVIIGCPLIQKYSESDVNMLLSQARSAIGDQEVGKIYHKYVSLRNACQTNARATHMLPVSANLRSFLAQNGIDIHNF